MIKSELKFLDLVGWRWICMTFLLSCNVYWTLELTYVGPRCLNKLLSVKLTCKKQRRVQICPIILRELLRLSSLFPRSVFWSWCAEGSFSTFSFPHSPAHLRSVGWCGRGRRVERGRGREALKTSLGNFHWWWCFYYNDIIFLSVFRRFMFTSKLSFETILSRLF